MRRRRPGADRRLSLLATLLAGWRACLVPAGAYPAGAPDDGVSAVVLVDVLPTDRAAGRAMLTGYVADARQDPNVRSVTLLQQDSIPNHFILVESFPSRAAYDRFVAEDRVRAFRAALFPHLGSPWDERRGAVPR